MDVVAQPSPGCLKKMGFQPEPSMLLTFCMLPGRLLSRSDAVFSKDLAPDMFWAESGLKKTTSRTCMQIQYNKVINSCRSYSIMQDLEGQNEDLVNQYNQLFIYFFIY